MHFLLCLPWHDRPSMLNASPSPTFPSFLLPLSDLSLPPHPLSVLCLLPYPQVIKKQLAEGVSRRRVGFVSAGAPARQHSEILNKDGKVVGEVTSGGFSPCLKKNIAMG